MKHATHGRIVQREIRGHLTKQGRTFTDVARKAGVEKTWLCRLHHTLSPPVEIVAAVAEVLGVEPWELYWPPRPVAEQQAA